MTIEIYGIPNCGTCKKALQWLDSNGIDYQFINTKENPPSRELIEAWAKLLTTKAMRNTSGQSYRALGEQKQDWSDSQWIDAFAKDAMLLKRPLFAKEGTAVLMGFRAKESELRQKLGV